MEDEERRLGRALTAAPAQVPDGLLLAALDYVIDDRVEPGLRKGMWVAARVRGFTDRYTVVTTLEAPWQGSCSCGRTAPCRHQIAVAVTARQAPERFFSLTPAPDLPGEVWGRVVWDLLTDQADPLAPLHALAQTAEEPPDGLPESAARDAEIAHAQGRSVLTPTLPAVTASLREAAHLRRAGNLDAAQARIAQAAQDLLTVVAGAGGSPLAADEVEALLEAALAEGDRLGPLAGAVRALFVVLDEAAAQAGIAFLESVVWEAARPERMPSARHDVRVRADRADWAVELLLERVTARSARPDEAVWAFLAAHAAAPAVRPWEARRHLAEGRIEEAERIALRAYPEASGRAYAALRAVLLDLVRAGREMPRRWLLAEWEAAPVQTDTDDAPGNRAGRAEAALLEILDAVPPSERDAVRAHAEAVLAEKHAYAALTRIAVREGRWRAAVRWALAEGPLAADAALCVGLAQRLSPLPLAPADATYDLGALAGTAPGGVESADPMTVLELLSAAYRRLPLGAQRNAVVRMAERFVRRAPGLGTSWSHLRRRYFPAPVGSAPAKGVPS